MAKVIWQTGKIAAKIILPIIAVGIVFYAVRVKTFAQTDAPAELELAESYYQNRQYPEAEQAYHNIIQQYPGTDYAFTAQESLTFLYLDWDKQPEAEAALQKLIADFPSYSDVANAINDIAAAESYWENKQFVEAEQIYTSIIQQYPDTDYAFSAQKDLIILYFDWEKQPQVEAAFQELVANFPSHPDIAKAVNKIAKEYFSFKEYEKADQLFQYVLDNFPDSKHVVRAQAGLAVSNVARGDDPNAQMAIDTLLTNFSEHQEIDQVIYDMAENCRQVLQKYEKAADLYQYVLDTWPDDEYAMRSQAGMAIVNIALGDDPNAQAALEELLTEFSEQPEIANAVYEMAENCRTLEKYDWARELYQYVLDTNPDVNDQAIWSQTGLVMASIGLGDDPNAHIELDRLIADFNDCPALPGVIFRIGQEYSYKEDYQQAIELWQLILSKYPARSPFETHMLCLLANCHEVIDDWQTAIEYYGQVLEQYPYSHFAHPAPHRIGLLYRFDGDYHSALYWFEQQRQLYPDTLEGQRALFEQAVVYSLDLKDYPTAIEVFEQYISEYPDDEHIWPAYRGLAKCYERIGNTAQAIAVLEEALVVFSETAYADKINQELQRLQEGG